MDAGAAVYAYDGDGRRMKKTVGSETTYYFYGVGGLLCEFTTTNTGATQASSTDRTTYRTSDKLGSAVLIINASGTVIENNRTLPYGEAWLAENTPSTNDKKFTTYQRDQESGLDYAMARYYDSRNARFASADRNVGSVKPTDPKSWNLYSYTHNDPVNKTDATGQTYVNIDSLMAPDGSILWSPDTGGFFAWPAAIVNAEGEGYPGVVFSPGPSRGGGGQAPARAPTPWEMLIARLGAARDFLNDKSFSADCNRTLGKLSGATMANGQRAGTINATAVLGAVNRAKISDGRDTPYWTVFGNATNQNQVRNSIATRNWTVADAITNLSRAAIGQEGGTSMYFDAGLNANRTDQELAATLFHEAMHNLGFSEPQLDAAGAGYNQILADCIKK